MHDKTPADLWELHRACRLLIEKTSGKSAADLKGDYDLSLVIERLLERIGETIRRMHSRDPEIVSRLPDYRRAIDLRNIIAHEYYTLDWNRIKTILDEAIPNLLATVDDLILEIPEPLA